MLRDLAIGFLALAGNDRAHRLNSDSGDDVGLDVGTLDLVLINPSISIC